MAGGQLSQLRYTLHTRARAQRSTTGIDLSSILCLLLCLNACGYGAVVGRLVSALGQGGTCVFLIFISDGCAYCFTIALLLWKAASKNAASITPASEVVAKSNSSDVGAAAELQLLVNFKRLAWLTGLMLIGVSSVNALYFHRRLSAEAASARRPAIGLDRSSTDEETRLVPSELNPTGVGLPGSDNDKAPKPLQEYCS